MEELNRQPSPQKIRLSLLRTEHLDDLAKMEKEAFSSPWSRNALAEELQNPLAVFYVAENSITRFALGYVGMHHILDEGYITNIVVSPDNRKQGIASTLIQGLIDYGQKHSLKRITLEVRVSNAPAISLYEKFHFKRDGIRPQFYDSPREDAAIYSLYF